MKMARLFPGWPGHLLLAGALAVMTGSAMADRQGGREAHGARAHKHATPIQWQSHGPAPAISRRQPIPGYAPHGLTHRPQHFQAPPQPRSPRLMWPSHGLQPAPSHGRHFSNLHLQGGLWMLAGTALLYNASQPRTVYYNVLPQTTTFITSQAEYPAPVSQANASLRVDASGIPVRVADDAPAGTNVVAGPGNLSSGWLYVCRNPVGVHPELQECPSGWEKRAAQE